MKYVLMLVVLSVGWAGMATAQTLPDWGDTTPMEDLYAPGDDLQAPELPDHDATPVPIDGGLSLLGAAGVAYALKRLRRR